MFVPDLSEAVAKKELAQDEERRLKEGGASVHKTGPDAFITMGLEIEESQYVHYFCDAGSRC